MKTYIEELAGDGNLYRMYLDITMASAAVKWFKMVVPATKYVRILDRQLMVDVIGMDYSIFTGASGSVVDVTNLCSTSQVNTMRGVAPLSTFASIGTAPTTTGTGIVSIFIGAGGGSSPNSKSSQTSTMEQGFKTYAPGSTIHGRLTNSSGTANRTVLKITWAEFDLWY